MLAKYYEQVERQEARMVEQGLPAQGISKFVRGWFEAWATQDSVALAEHMTPDCTYIDASTFQKRTTRGREETIASCNSTFGSMPDLTFYPQDDTIRSLPYYDYLDGQWRMTIPWRGIGRATGDLVLPPDTVLDIGGTVVDVSNLRTPPSGKCLDFIGIDRYMLTDDFKIAHIDTDWDILYAQIQLAPINLPKRIPTSLVKAAAAFQRLIVPALRALL
jgi:hypothetical protein